MLRTYLVIASFSMAVAVILGALGAHALADVLSATQLESFKTGVKYHIYHSLAIFIIILIPDSYLSIKNKSLIALLFSLGIFFFSFSIYLLSMRSVLGIEGLASYLGPVTPMGGLVLIVAWVILAFSILKKKNIK